MRGTIDAMDTLFTAMENDRRADVAPLAVRMRPRTLDEVVGQAEAVEGILTENGYEDIKIFPDTQGILRVVEGTINN